jgi:hypothetical protein
MGRTIQATINQFIITRYIHDTVAFFNVDSIGPEFSLQYFIGKGKVAITVCTQLRFDFVPQFVFQLMIRHRRWLVIH